MRVCVFVVVKIESERASQVPDGVVRVRWIAM